MEKNGAKMFLEKKQTFFAYSIKNTKIFNLHFALWYNNNERKEEQNVFKFIKKHWFAIGFDLLLAALLYFCNPPTISTVVITLFVLFLVIGLQVFCHKVYRWWKQLPGIQHFYRKEHTMEELSQKLSQAQLSNKDVLFIEDTFSSAQKQVQLLQKQFRKNNQLKVIQEKTNVIAACQGLLDLLAKNPEQFSRLGDFLYHYLPNLVDLVTQYLEVVNRPLASQETKDILQQSEQTITHLSLAIVDEYHRLTSSDLSGLSDSIRLAQKKLKEIQK